MPSSKRTLRRVGTGLGFLGPNILGFLAFTLVPLGFSLVLAFTNWDIHLHNIFKDEPLRFVGFANFARLFAEPDFWQYLGNTLFFMVGIPFGIAGSLLAAILLTQNLRGGSRRGWGILVGGSVLLSGVSMLILAGAGATAMILLLGGVAGMVLVGGAVGGRSVYRTLFYAPHFTAGVATMLLWKKLYAPQTGPVNHALRPLLNAVSAAVQSVPAGLVGGAGPWVCVGLMALLAAWGVRRLHAFWRDGDLGWQGTCLGGLFLLVPIALAAVQRPGSAAVWALAGGVAAFTALTIVRGARSGQAFPSTPDTGIGQGLMFGAVLMIFQLVLLGAGAVLGDLPAMAAAGLDPPDWLADYNWAKPSLMIMGFWAAVGSNNMLLYLAGLSNVPQALYEAADIDGASRFQRFWHVTWPQLAPVTFFIVVMSVIGGLQGGFEMARVMTLGGPAGATTTLSYYVYTEGFETGRLGYASAVAWALFALVFAVTLFNWKFGNRYVND
ncbi:sugar ABC transporter permease [bacterium]|nr:sugar ABC transporter permease [bacterium]